MECKTTEKPSYALKLGDWIKIRDEAIRGGLETPVMQIQFTGYGTTYELAVLSLSLFQQWHGFSQSRPIRYWELKPTEKQCRLKGQQAQDFFINSTYCKTDGALVILFENWPLAIIEWSLFTRLHEEYQP